MASVRSSSKDSEALTSSLIARYGVGGVERVLSPVLKAMNDNLLLSSAVFQTVGALSSK